MSDPTRKRLLERRPDGKSSHQYVRSGDTDLARTFARVRKQLKDEAKEASNVKPLVKRSKS